MEQKLSKGNLLGNGRSAEVFDLNSIQVVKLFYPGIALKSIEREFEIMQIVNATGVAAPTVDKIVKIEGRFGIVMDRAPGRTMLTQMSERPTILYKCANKLAVLHNDLHSRGGEGLPSQLLQLEERICSARQLAFNKKRDVLKVLGSLTGSGQLCHGDFHTDNILFDENETMIIDWVDASCGSRIADIAKTSIIIRLGTLPKDTPSWLRGATMLFRKLFHDRYLKRCIGASDENHQQFMTWQVPVAAARLSDGVKEEELPLLQLIDKGLQIYR